MGSPQGPRLRRCWSVRNCGIHIWPTWDAPIVRRLASYLNAHHEGARVVPVRRNEVDRVALRPFVTSVENPDGASQLVFRLRTTGITSPPQPQPHNVLHSQLIPGDAGHGAPSEYREGFLLDRDGRGHTRSSECQDPTFARTSPQSHPPVTGGVAPLHPVHASWRFPAPPLPATPPAARRPNPAEWPECAPSRAPSPP